MWIELTKRLIADCQFFEAASVLQIEAAEDILGVRFPDALKALFLESNGIHGQYGLGLIWSVERMREDNARFRTNGEWQRLYMPFNNLLFFADAGTGDQFAFTIHDGVVRRQDVFVWDHETDSRIWVAPSLEKYIEWWLTDKIKW